MLKFLMKLISKMIPQPSEIETTEAWASLERKRTRFDLDRRVL